MNILIQVLIILIVYSISLNQIGISIKHLNLYWNYQIQKLNEINENNKGESISIHSYIYNHIGYVLRKMKIDNKNYVMKLIKDILPNLLSNNNFEKFKDKHINNPKIKIQFK